MKRILFATIALALLSTAAAAQTSVTDGLAGLGEASASGRIVQMIAAVTVLSVAPGLLIMVTCFTRFVIALSFLRSGLGLQTTPANLIMISLALFMTFYVMAPTFDKAWQDGVKPLIETKITEEEAYRSHRHTFEAFMRSNVRDKDLQLFEDLAREKLQLRRSGRYRNAGADPGIHDFRTAAWLRDRLPDRAAISRHRYGRGNADHVDGHDDAATTEISLPFKVLFFVLIDGWNLLVGSLVRSFM